MAKVTAAYRVRQHKDEGLEVRNFELWCGRCVKKVLFANASTVKDHIESEKHKSWTQAVQISSTITTTDQLDDKWKSLVDAFVSAQIPLHVFRNEKLRNWMNQNVKYGHLLPSETTLRTDLNDLGKQDIEKTIQICQDQDVVLIVDETTDTKCRKVLNILVKPLDFNVKARLIVSKFIEKCDAAVVGQQVIKAMQLLKLDLERLVAIVTDNAPYMVKVGSNLATLCPRLMHTTCWAHILHLLSEEVRSQMPFTDEVISGVKKALLKAPARQSEYQAFMVKNGCKSDLPPIPILTRWTTWLEAGSFHWQNFDAIIDWVNNTEDSGAIMDSLKYLLHEHQDDIASELERIDKIYPRISTSLKNIESNKIVASDVWSTLKLIQVHLKELGMSLEKLELYLTKKHPSAQFWEDVQVLDPRKCPNDIVITFPETLRRFSNDQVLTTELHKYVMLCTYEERRHSNPIGFWRGYKKEMPILSKLALKALAVPSSSAEVERSFSFYKKLLDPQRTGLLESNASIHVRLAFNEDPTTEIEDASDEEME